MLPSSRGRAYPNRRLPTAALVLTLYVCPKTRVNGRDLVFAITKVPGVGPPASSPLMGEDLGEGDSLAHSRGA